MLHDELGRLGRASDRLLRMITVGAPLPKTDVDVDALLHQTAHRWSTVAPREWVVEAGGGIVEASAERLRACLDTLIENAVRHTAEGDVVLLYGSRTRDRFCLGVADSGPGLDTALAAAINSRQPHAAHLVAGEDGQGQSSRTGLGIALVEEIVEPRGGRVVVGRSHHGGALVLLVLPTEVPDLKAWGGGPSVVASTWAELSPDPPPRTGAGRTMQGVDPHPG